MAEFRIPNSIFYGDGTAQHLCSIHGQRLLMVYDAPQIKEPVQKLLSATDIAVRTFYADPYCADIPQVKEGTKALMEFKPEWILAAGGHGAIDLAKLIRIFYQRPDLTIQDAIQGKAASIPLDKTKLIALPMYNTNGSEATCSAYLWDNYAIHQYEIRSIGLMPDITIIDPSLLFRSNGGQLAESVLSTFILAIEATTEAVLCGRFVRPLALEAISILSKTVLAHSSASADKATIMYAQCLSGIAFSNSSPGLGGILCRAAASFGTVSFGSLGAAILPAVIKLDKNPNKYTAAALAMGLDDAAALADAVTEYADLLGLPLTLNEMGINKNTFLKKLSKVSHSVLSLLPSDTTEEKETQKHIEQILRMAYSHKEI